MLLAGCDAKEEQTKPEPVAAAPADVGGAAVAAEAVKTPEPPTDQPEEVVSPKVDLPLDVGTDEADPKTPEVETPKVETPKGKPLKEEPPGGTSPLIGKDRRPRATCPSGTWCTDKASAKKSAVRGAKFSLGCPDDVAGGAPGLGGPGRGSQSRGLDKAQTKAKRAAGTKDACCYGWYRPCPGGRPLLDDAGTPVVAPFETGLAVAWSGERDSLPASAQARAFAAQAWLDDAAMEHASVASFGRVALELLSLGAPPELVEGAHVAALDEIRHAKTCLSLARACGAEAVEPGRLAAVPQRSADFARFAADTFIEGCVGETVAALVVTRAAAGAEDADVRRALEEIAADEARHAALAWRMVSWAIERGGAPVVAAVLEAADRLRPQSNESSPPALEPEGIGRLGRLTSAQLSLARRDGWTGIIEPMLATVRARTASC